MEDRAEAMWTYTNETAQSVSTAQYVNKVRTAQLVFYLQQCEHCK